MCEWTLINELHVIIKTYTFIDVLRKRALAYNSILLHYIVVFNFLALEKKSS